MLGLLLMSFVQLPNTCSCRCRPCADACEHAVARSSDVDILALLPEHRELFPNAIDHVEVELLYYNLRRMIGGGDHLSPRIDDH